MKRVVISLFIFVVLFNGCIQGNFATELIGVAVCYRHGDRAPESSYPNDPFFDEQYWPDGFGQLLNTGKAHQFNLGRWLRSRYGDFLSERYSPKEIFVKSTDFDRTLTSAASNLAGLYYPENQEENSFWPEILPWNPVPIHTAPKDEDDVLYGGKPCENYNRLYQESLKSEYYEKILESHSGIKNFIELQTGLNITSIKTFQGLWTILYIYRTNSPSYLPEWATQVDEDELSLLAGVSFASTTLNRQLQRFTVGRFNDYLNSYFDGIINGTNPKFLMLSAHDGNIASILNSYGSYDPHIPPEFCSMIVWELYRTSEGIIFLKIFFKRNSDTDDLRRVAVGNCSDNCSYSTYQSIIADITLDYDTWERECSQKT